MKSEIESKADFGQIRYAQLWEDADILTQALGECKDQTLVSICSAGDNALAMLTLDPKRLVVVDLSSSQIACLKLRIGAYQTLKHNEFLQLMGARPSAKRIALLAKATANLDRETQVFWKLHVSDVEKYGAGGIGKFENYFRIFRERLLPFVHSKKTIDDVFLKRDKPARLDFFNKRFNSWRWRFLIKVFFSRFIMGRMGRDKAFFDHVDGSPSEHVARRLYHAAVITEPAENPYLHWILKGTHGQALPMAWRKENFDKIKSRLSCIEIKPGSLEAFISTGEKADGWNLSDIFEYMSPAVFETVYGDVLKASAPKARLVYWNMMAPRRVPKNHASKVTTLTNIEGPLKAMDKAFFYSDFVVEEVIS